MFILAIVEFPFTEQVSARLALLKEKLRAGANQELGFLVKAAKAMSQQLRDWLGQYVADGKVEIRNLERGSKVNGHVSQYKIIKPLDHGAMATIFEVEESDTGRQLVLKALSGLQEEVVVRRFMREARILASLNHPNIVSVYDLSNEVKMPFIVMEPLTHSADKNKTLNFKYLV